MTELAWVLVAFASAVVAADVAVILFLRRIYRQIRRHRAVQSAALRVRTQLSRGPRREALKLRARLNETLDSGRAAVDLVEHREGLRGELPRVFRRLEREGDALDAQLRLMESENDSTVLTQMLPIARDRVDQVAHMVRRLRSAVATVLSDPVQEGLTSLRSELDNEITAVHAGMQELQKLRDQGPVADSLRERSATRFIKD